MAELPITMDDSIPQQAGPGAGADQLHSAIMNLPCKHGDWSDENGNMAYKIGHRDARHAAAELALSHLAAPLAVEDSRDAARYRWLRDSAVHTEGFCAWAVSGINAGDAIPCIGSELDELVDAAMAAASSGAQPEQQQGQGLVHPAMSTSGRTSVEGGERAPSAADRDALKADLLGLGIAALEAAIEAHQAAIESEVAAAWLHDDGERVCTAKDKTLMEGNGFGVWAENAKRYSTPLFTRPVAQPANTDSASGSPSKPAHGQMDNKGIPSHD